MTGRQKIEAAFSREGASEFAAAICWEDIFIRDHWDKLMSAPWYDLHSPDLERQMAWIHLGPRINNGYLRLLQVFATISSRVH